MFLDESCLSEIKMQSQEPKYLLKFRNKHEMNNILLLYNLKEKIIEDYNKLKNTKKN